MTMTRLNAACSNKKRRTASQTSRGQECDDDSSELQHIRYRQPELRSRLAALDSFLPPVHSIAPPASATLLPETAAATAAARRTEAYRRASQYAESAGVALQGAADAPAAESDIHKAESLVDNLVASAAHTIRLSILAIARRLQETARYVQIALNGACMLRNPGRRPSMNEVQYNKNRHPSQNDDLLPLVCLILPRSYWIENPTTPAGGYVNLVCSSCGFLGPFTGGGSDDTALSRALLHVSMFSCIYHCGLGRFHADFATVVNHTQMQQTLLTPWTASTNPQEASQWRALQLAAARRLEHEAQNVEAWNSLLRRCAHEDAGSAFVLYNAPSLMQLHDDPSRLTLTGTDAVLFPVPFPMRHTITPPLNVNPASAIGVIQQHNWQRNL